jgi:hypothetical protein
MKKNIPNIQKAVRKYNAIELRMTVSECEKWRLKRRKNTEEQQKTAVYHSRSVPIKLHSKQVLAVRDEIRRRVGPMSTGIKESGRLLACTLDPFCHTCKKTRYEKRAVYSRISDILEEWSKTVDAPGDEYTISVTDCKGIPHIYASYFSTDKINGKVSEIRKFCWTHKAIKIHFNKEEEVLTYELWPSLDMKRDKLELLDRSCPYWMDLVRQEIADALALESTDTDLHTLSFNAGTYCGNGKIGTVNTLLGSVAREYLTDNLTAIQDLCIQQKVVSINFDRVETQLSTPPIDCEQTCDEEIPQVLSAPLPSPDHL